MCLKLTPWVAIGSVPVWLAVVLVVEAVAADVQPQIAGESEQAPRGLAVEFGGMPGHVRRDEAEPVGLVAGVNRSRSCAVRLRR